MMQTQKKDAMASKIASMLLNLEAITIHPDKPFEWTSGWFSPIHCDNLLTLSYPQDRDFIKDALVQLVKQNFSNIEAIAGIATAGIPYGVLIADSLKLPFLYVRAQPKPQNPTSIEGKITKGQRVVVIEDLVATGNSALNAIKALQLNEFEVLGMTAIFHYNFDIAHKRFEKEKLPIFSLTNYTHILIEAVRANYITEEDMALLHRWRKNPSKWPM